MLSGEKRMNKVEIKTLTPKRHFNEMEKILQIIIILLD